MFEQTLQSLSWAFAYSAETMQSLPYLALMFFGVMILCTLGVFFLPLKLRGSRSLATIALCIAGILATISGYLYVWHNHFR